MPNVRNVIANSRNKSAGPIIFPRNIAKYGMLFMFSKYDYTQTRNVVGFNADSLTGESVVLPLPTAGLAEKSAIELADTNLTPFGEAIAQVSAGGGFGSLMGGFGGEVDGAAASRVGISALASIAGAGGASKIAGLAALSQPSLSVGTGTSFNRFTALSFNSVGLRDHNFTWRLFPESRADSETIAMIRNMFQKASHPSYANLGTSTGNDLLGRVVLNYPLLVRPYILIDQAEKYYYQYRPCLISSVQFQYKAETGMSFVENGKPAQVEMTLGLKEASIWTAEDYGGGDPSLSPLSSVGNNFYTPHGTI